MTLNQLRTFLMVADLGSVHAAADQLIVTQPAVSAAISALERELGVDLVARDGRGLRITAAGRAFADAVRAGLSQLEHGVRVATSIGEPERGSVRIAAIATAAERLVLPRLGAFRVQHPLASVTVRVGNRAVVWAALRDLDADLVVAGRPPSSAAAVVLGRAANLLALVGAAAEVSGPRSRRELLAHLGSTTWLLREDGSGTRDATEELLDRLALDPPRMILGSNGAVEQGVVAGFGVGLLPLDVVTSRIDAGEMCRLDCPGTPIDRPWHLVTSSVGPLSPTAALAARSLLLTPGFSPSPEGRRLLRH